MRLDPRGAALALGVALPLALFLGLILRPGLDTTPPGVAVAADAVRSTGAREIEIRFVRESDARIRIEDVRNGRTLRTATAADGGFLWGILRPLDRERTRFDAGLAEPYRVTRTRDGRLLLQDPSTDLEVDLAAFGPTSVALFDALLTGGPMPSIPALFPSPSSMEDRP